MSEPAKRVLAIIGSPRKHGNTWSVVRRVEAAMLAHGPYEFSYLFLADANLQICIGCWRCLADGEQCCPRRDDRDSILRRMEAADAFVFAAPVYAMGMPALMKNLYDRLAFTAHRPRFFDKPALLVATTGAFGLGGVLRQLSFFKFAGCGPLVRLGLQASETTVEPAAKLAMEKKIRRAARSFRKALAERTPRPAGLVRAVIFHVQRAVFGLHAAYPDQMGEADFAWFKEHGWLEPGARYFTGGRVHLFARLIGRWQGWLVRRMAVRGLRGVPWKDGTPE